jgi:hypothetical protein
MQTIEIVVPTRNRIEKLLRMLESVKPAARDFPIRITIVCDGDRDTARLLPPPGWVDFKVIFSDGHNGAVYCRNLATAEAEDAVLYATDDIAFEKESIEAAAKASLLCFPEDDGVVGFSQTGNGKYSPAGVALVGKNFLAHYPKKELFFPGYFHFACQEVYRAAVARGRFFFCQDARLVHFHPSFDRDEADETHKEARKHRGKDKALSFTRDGAGLTWGTGTEAAR